MTVLRKGLGLGSLASPSSGRVALSLLLLLPALVAGYDLDPSSKGTSHESPLFEPYSVKTIAASMTKNMLSFYHGNEPGGIPGLLPTPYYWWEAGAMMGSLIDYWYYTGDTQYNDLTSQALLFQVGPYADYMPPNQTLTEGNDDQGFWGLSVMSAAEYNFPNPPADKPQWLALAQAVFNTQAPRWEPADCKGGLRWQIFTWNTGYDYKNSISQACFFNLAARLLLYTGNTTYGDWATTTWDWMVGVKFLDDSYYVYDGAHTYTNCTDITPYQWTYNAGAFLLGAAAMYNYSSLVGNEDQAALWRERVDGLLNGTDIFFTTSAKDIMTEVACEPVDLCDTDQKSFKAYLSRWMAATIKWAPWTESTIMPLLRASSVAAAAQCTGGDNGEMCGLKWTDNGTWDGTTGVGQQMAAMEVVLANMIEDVTAPVTNSTGGTSQGDPNAGGSDIGRTDPYSSSDLLPPITTADRVGAGILTAVVLAAVIAGVTYVLIDETVPRTPKEHWAVLVASVVSAGKTGKHLTKRALAGGGSINTVDGSGAVVMSEKEKQSRVQSFRVIDRSDSDRSSASAASSSSNDGIFINNSVSPRSSQQAGGASVSLDSERSLVADRNGKAAHHGFFAPAHFRSHGTAPSGAAASRSRGQSWGPSRSATGTYHQSSLSDPSTGTTLRSPPPAASPSKAPPDSIAELPAGPAGTGTQNTIKRKNLQKRKPMSSS